MQIHYSISTVSYKTYEMELWLYTKRGRWQPG